MRKRLLGCVLAGLAACGAEERASGSGGIDGGASSLQIEGEGTRVADGEDSFAAVVRLVSSDGAAVAGRRVRIRSAVDGEVLAELPPSDAAGWTQGLLRTTVAKQRKVVAVAGAEGDEVVIGPARTIEFVAGPPVRLAFAQLPADPAVGRYLSPAVEVAFHDAFGNEARVDSIPVTLSAEGDSLELRGTTAVEPRGRAVFDRVWLEGLPGQLRLVAEADGMERLFSEPLVATEGGALVLDASVPASPRAGEATALSVTVRDSGGAQRADVVGRVELRLVGEGPGEGRMSGTLAADVENGVARFDDLRFDDAGRWLLEASGAGAAGAAVAIEVEAAEPDPAYSGLLLPPDAVLADGANEAEVRVVLRDRFANPVVGHTVTFVLSGELNHPFTDVVASGVDGEAVARFRSWRAETKRIAAEAAATDLRFEGEVRFVPGPIDPDRSSSSIMPSAVIADGTPAAAVVRLQDASGNPIAGVEAWLVDWPQVAFPHGDRAVSDASGVATIPFVAQRPGIHWFDLFVNEGGGFQNLASEEVDIAGTAPETIEPWRGGNGAAPLTTELPGLEVRVLGRGGIPARPTVVGFESETAQLSATAVWIGSDGLARTSVTLPSPGEHVVTVRAGDVERDVVLTGHADATDVCWLHYETVLTFDGLAAQHGKLVGPFRAVGDAATVADSALEVQVRFASDAGMRGIDALALRAGGAPGTLVVVEAGPALRLAVDGTEASLPAVGASAALGAGATLHRVAEHTLRIEAGADTLYVHGDGAQPFFSAIGFEPGSVRANFGLCGDRDGDAGDDGALIEATAARWYGDSLFQ